MPTKKPTIASPVRPVQPSVTPCGCGERAKGVDPCVDALQRLEVRIARDCGAKAFSIPGDHGCPTGTPTTTTSPVDLVVLIDTSGSMSDEATTLSAAADAAIAAAMKQCPADLRVVWLGLEGTFAATKFTTTLRDHLKGLGVTDAQMKVTSGQSEDGAPAIVDLANWFDWRPGAARAVLYLTDEGLLHGDPHDATDVAAADDAIVAANSAGLRVHTYAGTGVTAAVEAELQRVASQTGGASFSSTTGIGGFQAVLEKVICASTTGSACATARFPELQPCFELRWGDGNKDQMETEDFEVLCITACNPYDNVRFTNLVVYAVVVVDGSGGTPPALPNGDPSVLIKPSYAIWFGDLEPCSGGTKGCVSRELVLKTDGAMPGPYTVRISGCFSVSFSQVFRETFPIELVSS